MHDNRNDDQAGMRRTTGLSSDTRRTGSDTRRLSSLSCRQHLNHPFSSPCAAFHLRLSVPRLTAPLLNLPSQSRSCRVSPRRRCTVSRLCHIALFSVAPPVVSVAQVLSRSDHSSSQLRLSCFRVFSFRGPRAGPVLTNDPM